MLEGMIRHREYLMAKRRGTAMQHPQNERGDGGLHPGEGQGHPTCLGGMEQRHLRGPGCAQAERGVRESLGRDCDFAANNERKALAKS